MPLSPDEIARGRAFLAGEPSVVDEGGAAMLAHALDRPVAQAIVAERAPVYVTLLHAMLRLRHEHELEPLHDDLERLVAPALLALEPGRDEQAFARDLDALASWGCVDRHAEPLKIRGYKDLRRERFRYRLTEDAVSLLAWLEGRLEARLEGRANDGRDLLVDVLGQASELLRVVGSWHRGDRGEDAPRRTMFLLGRIDERVHAITEELLTFRASMLDFAARPYDRDALLEILTWLERYVSVYVTRMRTLGAEIAAKLEEVQKPRFARILAEHHVLLSRERAETPSAFRAGASLRDPLDLLAAQRPFFDQGGRLPELCARIDTSARAVLKKMHRHLRELERRNARLEDLRARASELAQLPASASLDDRLASFMNTLVASAHGRFSRRGPPERDRVEPPLPRRHSPSSVDRSQRFPLRAKQAPAEAVRELRARRLANLKAWVAAHVLGGSDEVVLSAHPPDAPGSARRWFEVARARHLDRGRDLARLGVAIAPRDGAVRIQEEGEGLECPDCRVRAVS